MLKSIVSDLDQLEAEAIFILREVKAQFEKPVLLFSGGKDSITVAHLAKKAFAPGKVPFPLLHIDTGHNFPETLKFRDEFVKKHSLELKVRYVQDSIDAGKIREEKKLNSSRNAFQSVTLLDAIEEFQFDAAIGGARRDEEKARAKERVFSHRNEFGQWDPKNQRPELWSLYNGSKNPGEHFRIFPLSHWTELDVWHYIQRENIELPSLYFAHMREVIRRKRVWLARCEFVVPSEHDEIATLKVRFRTVGDLTSTGAIESEATTVNDIIEEVTRLRTTERGTRADDKVSESAMEDRKRQGYF